MMHPFILSALLFLMLIHGIVHLLGFLRLRQLNNGRVSLRAFFWLSTFVAWLLSAAVLVPGYQWWYLPALISALLSQVLILQYGREASTGTLPNLIVAIACLYYIFA
jgi:hypothetical protein